MGKRTETVGRCWDCRVAVEPPKTRCERCIALARVRRRRYYEAHRPVKPAARRVPSKPELTLREHYEAQILTLGLTVAEWERLMGLPPGSVYPERAG